MQSTFSSKATGLYIMDIDLSKYSVGYLQMCLRKTEAGIASDREAELARAFLMQYDAAKVQDNRELEEDIRRAEKEREQIKKNMRALDEYHRRNGRKDGEDHGDGEQYGGRA